MVRYSYGEWKYYALARTGIDDASGAVLWPTRAGLGRRELPGLPGAAAVRRRLRVAIEHLHRVIVDSSEIERLRASLDSIYEANIATLIYNTSYDLEFVHHPSVYWAFHNSNQVVAGWLEQLGCRVEGAALFSSWKVAPRRYGPAVAAGAVEGRAAASRDTVEFVRAREGGLCFTPEGGALCQLRIVVADDGRWRATGTEPPAPAVGTVVEGAASRLAAVLDAGWEALTARPFTGTCPSAYDGQETWYAVRRLPTGPGAELADARVRELRSCTYDLEHAEARRVLQRLEDLWRELGLPE